MRDIKPFILNQLKELQSKNSDNVENYFLYDVGKPIGGKLEMKILCF
jgi:hypothetical protein